MRIAIIDLGTNSVRFDVHQLGPGKKIQRIHREKIMVRLGQGVFLNGKLDRNAIRRTLHSFIKFRRLASRYGVTKTVAFGTSAIREVQGRESFLQTIEERTGIRVRVISGMEEAQLIALGVLTREKAAQKSRKGTLALIDIGGGSTEISICRGKKVLHSHSFPIGTARVQQLFLKKSPPRPEQVGKLREYLRVTLYGVLLPEHWPSAARVIGSSGTVRALARILSKITGKNVIDRDDLVWLVEQMRIMSPVQLLEIPGMEPKRVDMILGGAIVLQECMDAVGAHRVLPTEYSLRDGILEEEIRLLRQGESSHLALHREDFLEKARHFGLDEKHLKEVAILAETVFDHLAPVHKLKGDARLLLTAAAVLRDTGEAISPLGHPDHSYYIVKNADLAGAEPSEVEWIARLCRYHEHKKGEQLDLGFIKNKGRRGEFLKLLALLRLVDALDQGPEVSIVLRKPKIQPRRVIIPYAGRGLTGLEGLEVERCREFVSESLGRSVELVKGR